MKKNNILTIILIIIIIGLSSFIIYDKVLSNNTKENSSKSYKNYKEDCSNDTTKCTISYTFETNKNYTSVVEPNDKFVTKNNSISGEIIFILNDGNLYYTVENCSDNSCNDINYILKSDSKKFLSELNKLTNVTNIKRIKLYNPTVKESWDLFLITNEGEVYKLDYNNLNNKITTTKVEEFSKYKVDDIIEYNFSVPYGAEYKLTLNDGTTLIKTIDTK